MLLSICKEINYFNYNNENILKWNNPFDNICQTKNRTINKTTHNKHMNNTVGKQVNDAVGKQVNDAVGKQVNDAVILTDLDEQDRLFWLFYIIKYGLDEYKEIKRQNKTFSIEKEVKIQTITDMRKMKDIYKQYKIKRTTVEDSLINERVINYDAFQILCINNDIDVILIINNFFHLFQGDKTRELRVDNIIAFNNNKITLLKPDGMSDLLSNKMEIKNLSKPLNSISYYKLGDLKEICDKLEIKYLSNDKKMILYKKLENYIYKNLPKNINMPYN